MEGVRPDTFVSHWWGEDFGLPANFAIFAVLCSTLQWLSNRSY